MVPRMVPFYTNTPQPPLGLYKFQLEETGSYDLFLLLCNNLPHARQKGFCCLLMDEKARLLHDMYWECVQSFDQQLTLVVKV